MATPLPWKNSPSAQMAEWAKRRPYTLIIKPGKVVNLTPVDIITANATAGIPTGAMVVKVDTQAEITLLTNAAFFRDGIDTSPEHILTLGGIAGTTSMLTEGHGIPSRPATALPMRFRHHFARP